MVKDSKLKKMLLSFGLFPSNMGGNEGVLDSDRAVASVPRNVYVLTSHATVTTVRSILIRRSLRITRQISFFSPHIRIQSTLEPEISPR
jgi:hypothetical protein